MKKSSYNEKAKEWAEHLRTGKNLAHEYLEKPAMYKKLPNLKNKKILCVGCGSGEECDYLNKRGAKEIIGIDLSKELIKIARESYPNLKFEVMNMEEMNFSKGYFDFIYSSLAMHYVKDWAGVLKKIKNFLKKDGVFIFSTHHPALWGAEVNRSGGNTVKLLGYKKEVDPYRIEIFGDYLNVRKINDVWFGNMHVTYYNKPISIMFNEIKKSGFEIVDIVEPRTVMGCKKDDLQYYELHQRIPLFIIFELKKIK